MSTQRLAVTATVVLAVLSLAGRSSALAGTHVVEYALPSPDLAGITAAETAGSSVCAAGCARIALQRSAGGLARAARLAFAAPRGTTVETAEVRLAYRTPSASAVVRLLGRLDGRWLEARRLRSAALRTDAVRLRGAGGDAFAVQLVADGRTGGFDSVAIAAVRLTVRDAVPPEVHGALDDPGDAEWRRGEVCHAYEAADAGLGVARVELAIGPAVAAASTAVGPRLQPWPSTASGSVCVDTAQLEDGVYGTALTAVDGGEGGNRSTPIAGLVRIDNAPPAVRYASPVERATRIPVASLIVADAASGIAEVRATIDGLPAIADIADGTWRVQPTAPLADGTHALAWSVADAAGNRTEGVAALSVDASAPVLVVGGLGSDGAVCAFASDSGSGIDAGSWRILVDGADATAQAVIGPERACVRRTWGGGAHRVRAMVRDLEGNPATAAGAFTAPRAPDDRTHPLALRARARRVPIGGIAELTGSAPASVRRVVIEVRIGGLWRRVTAVRLDAAGGFSAAVRLPAGGAYALRARSGGITSPPIRLLAG